ncbi:hypothetical protein BH24CHL6_BH24CHL6_10890 [soil metagenome]
MPGISARFRIVLAIVLAVSFGAVVQTSRPTVAERSSDISIARFMTGLACIESSGRYNAVNKSSGAIGKYQIMPRNWRIWAGRVLGSQRAEPTPSNQEIVAHWRIERLYNNRGTWRRVAYWWLTGRSINDESRWSLKARRYVNRVMAIVERAADPERASSVPARCRPNLPSTVSVASDGAAAVRVTARALNVRRDAGIRHRVIAIVRRGAEVPVLDQTRLSSGRVWLRVELNNGRKGWIARWHTRPIRAE